MSLFLFREGEHLVEITIGKFMYQSIDDEVLTIMKKDKEVYRMNIREIEITFYQPEATFSRSAWCIFCRSWHEFGIPLY